MKTETSHSEENLRLIEKAYPFGKIYTIYSLNLRYLFELDKERELRKKIRKLRLKSQIITWLKARYLQKEFETEDKKESETKGERKEFIHNKFESYEEEESEAKSNIVNTFYEKFEEDVKTEINKQGQIFYFLDENSTENNYGCEFEKDDKDEKETLFKILHDFNDALKNIKYDDEITDKSEFYEKETTAKERLNKLIKDISEQNNAARSLKENIDSLNKSHTRINEQIQEEKSNLYDEIRRAEKFLASDQFAKFTEDPFFKISKDIEAGYHRIIKIGGEKRKLINATNEEKETIDNGHEFSIFRGHLKDKWLNSLTYKIINGTDSYFIRLSRYGLLQIRKEEKLEGNCIFIDVLTDLLKAQKRYSYEEKPKVKDDILEVAVGFAKLLEFKTVSNFAKEFKDRKITPIDIKDAKARYKSLEREKYTILFLTKIEKDKASDFTFSPSDLEEKFPSAISCMLQGSLEIPETSLNIELYQSHNNLSKTGVLSKETLNKMLVRIFEKQLDEKKVCRYDALTTGQRNTIQKKLSGYYIIPRIPNPVEKAYVDLSTWDNELCVFKPERGLIFFKERKTLESGNRVVDYEDYWKSIVRGVEYTVALRATLQILESRTTRLLDKIPEILNLSNDTINSNLKENESLDELKEKEKEKKFEKAQKRVLEMAEDLASILKVLPSLRSIAIPTRAFRSGHSVKKFSYLYNRCFNLKETFENIQKNIDELTDFLTFFEQQHLQIKLDKETHRETDQDRKLSKAALFFTVASILYIFPSFVNDFKELSSLHFTVWQLLSPEWGLTLLWLVIFSFFLFFIFLIYRQKLKK